MDLFMHKAYYTKKILKLLKNNSTNRFSLETNMYKKYINSVFSLLFEIFEYVLKLMWYFKHNT